MENEILEKLNQINENLRSIKAKVDKQDERIALLENEQGLSGESAKLDAPPPPPPPETAIKTAAEKAADKLDAVWSKNRQSKTGQETGNFGTEEKGAWREDKSDLVDSRLSDQASSEPDAEEKNKDLSVVSSSLEEKIGGKFFLKVGMVVLVLGISFLLKYAFDNNWIGPTGRVLIGLFTGLALLGLGEKTIRKYPLYGQITSGGGIVILYLSVFAALDFYSLINNATAFLFMIFVTAIGVALSLRYNAASLIITSVLGGFLTPILVSTGENNQVVLFSYIIMLDLAVLAVSVFKRWHWLQLIGFVGTIFVFLGWYEKFYTFEQLASTFLFLTIFFVIYSISALAFNLVKKEESSGVEQIISLTSGLIYFSFAYSILNIHYEALMGFFAFVLAFYYFLQAYVTKMLTPKDDNLYNFLAFLSLGFITLAIPLQFNSFLITIVWTIEACLLVLIASRLQGQKSGIINLFAVVVYSLVIFRLLAFDVREYEKGSIFLFNPVMLSALLAVASLYFSAVFVKTSKQERILGTPKDKLFKFVIVVASLVTVFTVSRDVNIYHDNINRIERDTVQEYNEEIRQTYGSADEYLKQVDYDAQRKVSERGQVYVSLFVLAYGTMLVIVGYARRRTYLLSLGTLLNFYVLLKLFLHDLWSLDSAWRRVLSFFSIVAAYFNSVLYYDYSRHQNEEKPFLPALKLFVFFVVAANVLTIVGGSRELYLHFDNKIDQFREESELVCNRYAPFSKGFSSSFDGGAYQYNQEACDQYRAKIKRWENIASVAISLYWLIYAIVLIIVGFWKRYKWVRVGGILLLLVAIIKLFFVDLWALGQLYRIVASISLGAVLLGISFLYQKYKSVFREML